MFDVLIIGAGVIGSLIARELSAYELKICLLDKASDVAMGMSGANSGIVHAGYDPKPGSMKAKFNLQGNAMFEELCSNLDVPYEKKGSLVLAFDDYEEQKLIELFENGRKNQVPLLSLISKDEVLALEPLLSADVKSALFAPTAAITCPYSLTIAAAENAVENGVVLKLGERVTHITLMDGVYHTTTQNAEYTSKYIVNAAGVFADEISAFAGAEKLTIHSRKGEYILFDKTVLKPDKIIFQSPSRAGKGVLVTATVHGNLMIGPSATDILGKNDVSVTSEGLSHVIAAAMRSFPHIHPKDAITQFAGLRANAAEKDFIIQPSALQRGFIQVAGIASPGLTAAPAIAKYVAMLLYDEGLQRKPKGNFYPKRRRIPCFNEMTRDERNALIQENPLYGKIICRCENVSEAEIIESIQRSAGATTLDGVKRRVRAGMGRCQGGFCSSAVLSILARELKQPPVEITKCGAGSNILAGYTK